MMNKWHFPLSNNSVTRGLKESGIETFKGQILSSLTREIIQNSLDARKTELSPVKVVFKYFNISNKDFPDIETFKNNIVDSIEESKLLKDTTTLRFFEDAKKIIENDKIPFVRISDFNTNGLTGSRTSETSDWKNLVMSSGVSDKNSEAGGSFGIGKNAPFACSSLHTIFYSTLDKEGLSAHQGVSNLISVNRPEKNDHTQGIGYYASNSAHSPIYEQASFDATFERLDSGTDIYIAGFRFSKEIFEKEIVKSVLDNFLYAIYKETLIVETNGSLINKETLKKTVELNKSIIEKESNELLELLENENTIWHRDFRNNEADLALLIDSEGSRKISAIRKPWMKIRYFDGFSRTVDFIGAFIIHGKNLNADLRRMENQQHDKWETDRLSSYERKLGITLLQDIRRYISNKILELNTFDSDQSLELIGADEYIRLIDDESMSKNKKVKEKITDISVKKSKIVKSNQKLHMAGDFETYVDEGNEDDLFERILHQGGLPLEPSRKPQRTQLTAGKKVSIKRNQIKLAKVSNNGSYRLFYKSEINNTKVNLSIFPIDEEGTKIEGLLKISKAWCLGEQLDTEENVIKGVTVSNNVINILFKTNLKNALSLGVDIYEVNQ